MRLYHAGPEALRRVFAGARVLGVRGLGARVVVVVVRLRVAIGG
jgi:hypothetical protein